MAKTWNKYEVLVLIDADLPLETIEGMIERFREIIRSNQGKVLKTERWGIRNMAFAIKRKTKSYYTLLEFAGEGPVSIALSHQLNLLDTVIKFQIVKLGSKIDPETLPDVEEIIDQPIKSLEEARTFPVRGDDEEEEEMDMDEDED